MEAAHDTALDDLIRDVCDQGVATVETRLLLRWYERKNMGKAIWKDLQRRYDAVLKDRGEDKDGWRFFAIPGDHVVSLLCFDPEGSDDPWWKSVADLG